MFWNSTTHPTSHRKKMEKPSHTSDCSSVFLILDSPGTSLSGFPRLVYNNFWQLGRKCLAFSAPFPEKGPRLNTNFPDRLLLFFTTHLRSKHNHHQLNLFFFCLWKMGNRVCRGLGEQQDGGRETRSEQEGLHGGR